MWSPCLHLRLFAPTFPLFRASHCPRIVPGEGKWGNFEFFYVSWDFYDVYSLLYTRGMYRKLDRDIMVLLLLRLAALCCNSLPWDLSIFFIKDISCFVPLSWTDGQTESDNGRWANVCWQASFVGYHLEERSTALQRFCKDNSRGERLWLCGYFNISFSLSLFFHKIVLHPSPTSIPIVCAPILTMQICSLQCTFSLSTHTTPTVYFKYGARKSKQKDIIFWKTLCMRIKNSHNIILHQFYTKMNTHKNASHSLHKQTKIQRLPKRKHWSNFGLFCIRYVQAHCHIANPIILLSLASFPKESTTPSYHKSSPGVTNPESYDRERTSLIETDKKETFKDISLQIKFLQDIFVDSLSDGTKSGRQTHPNYLEDNEVSFGPGFGDSTQIGESTQMRLLTLPNPTTTLLHKISGSSIQSTHSKVPPKYTDDTNYNKEDQYAGHYKGTVLCMVKLRFL